MKAPQWLIPLRLLTSFGRWSAQWQRPVPYLHMQAARVVLGDPRLNLRRGRLAAAHLPHSTGQLLSTLRERCGARSGTDRHCALQIPSPRRRPMLAYAQHTCCTRGRGQLLSAWRHMAGTFLWQASISEDGDPAICAHLSCGMPWCHRGKCSQAQTLKVRSYASKRRFPHNHFALACKQQGPNSV